jgi:serine/threonine protein kinase
MSAFVELHGNLIMHRDFKNANIFLANSQDNCGGRVIIGDFGLAKSGAEVATTRLGTPYNMAPELLDNTSKF